MTPVTPETLDRVIVCGSGLAAAMTVATLAHHLPAATKLTWLEDAPAPDADLFYGSITGPSAYEFNLSAGLAEPRLLLSSDTAFAYGTHYQGWGAGHMSWVQGYQQPFPILGGVLFQHYLSQQKLTAIEPFLITAMAGQGGLFAHPPESGNHPLSRAEYGYQFDPVSYAAQFAGLLPDRVERLSGEIADIDHDENGIAALRLSNGTSLKATFYIDCTGPQARLVSQISPAVAGGRRLTALASRRQTEVMGPALRRVTAAGFGWRSESALQGSLLSLTICDPESEDLAQAAHDGAPTIRATVTLGHRAEAWVGNCLAIGHAAGVVEPLTVAPMILLQRDIERLLTLFPTGADMAVERREYNRHYGNDYEHAGLFNRAFFAGEGFPQTPYWQAAQADPVPEKLQTKIVQFESRGLHVGFDLEPFHQEDWIILHYGMGRTPRRYDRTADKATPDMVQPYLRGLRADIEAAVKAMPSHDRYMKGLTQFLAKNEG